MAANLLDPVLSRVPVRQWGRYAYRWAARAPLLRMKEKERFA